MSSTGSTMNPLHADIYRDAELYCASRITWVAYLTAIPFSGILAVLNNRIMKARIYRWIMAGKIGPAFDWKYKIRAVCWHLVYVYV